MTEPAAAPDRRVLAALMLPMFGSLLSISSVMVALPAIEEGLGATPSDLQWVLSGYALAFGVGMSPCGASLATSGAGAACSSWASPSSGAPPGRCSGAEPSGAEPHAVHHGVRLITAGAAGHRNHPAALHGRCQGRAYGMMSTVIGLGLALGPCWPECFWSWATITSPGGSSWR
ncbi:hypothetical protein [Nesterenkonia pannonica]|uniref:hypothetical protein n=1 Tax=Nesterenkonia pannonica TaxID=1548602 RepID=UPI0021645E11|nr:hypothetical protein [Nesterenkonia pannonica]